MLASAFDARADAYDRQFTATIIGSMMRKAVWARCAARFAPGSRILEMNCGTGEDALWLARRGVHVLATDISSPMLEIARRKQASAQAGAPSRFRQMAWEELGALDEAPFDGMLSNFGGLNCVSDLEGAAQNLAPRLRPGATAILCIMGPVVPWEWIWFLLRGKPSTAFRRLRRGGAKWSDITIAYPSIAKVRRAFARDFRMLRVSAIGALLPPPYTENRIGQFSRALRTLNWLERRFEATWPLPLIADHYLLELERIAS